MNTNNNSDFIIENGVLETYQGPGGDVVIPEGVTWIGRPKDEIGAGNHAFQSFQFRTDLTTVIIPDGVIGIGNCAFYGCTGLTSVTFPTSLTEIGWGAFLRCDRLTQIILPRNVRSLSGKSFAEGTVVTAPGVSFPMIKELSSRMKRCLTYGYLLHNEYYPPEIASEYQEYLFRQKTKWLSVIFQDDISSALRIFSGAGKINAKNFEKEFLVPATEANAAECVAFLLDWRSHNISEEEMIRQSEQALKRELMRDGPTAAELKKIWSTAKRVDGTLSICKYKGLDGDVVIPNKIGRKLVTAIGRRAFGNCKGLSSVIIPGSVTKIAWDAFSGCSSLTIHAPACSYAEQYAEKHRIPFIAE